MANANEKPTLLSRLMALFNSAGETVTEDELKAELAAATAPHENPNVAKLQSSVEALKGKVRHDNAVAFAKAMVTAGKIMPAELDIVAEQHERNAIDDARYPEVIKFGAPDGEGKFSTQSGTRVEQFETLLKLRPDHKLTAEYLRQAIEEGGMDARVLFNKAATVDPDAPKPMDEARRLELLGMTAVGTQVLDTRKAAK